MYYFPDFMAKWTHTAKMVWLKKLNKEMEESFNFFFEDFTKRMDFRGLTSSKNTVLSRDCQTYNWPPAGMGEDRVHPRMIIS